MALDSGKIFDELSEAAERMIQMAIPEFKFPEGSTRDEKSLILEKFADKLNDHITGQLRLDI